LLFRCVQGHAARNFRPLPANACAFAGGKVRGERKASLFIRSDAHVVRAGLKAAGKGGESRLPAVQIRFAARQTRINCTRRVQFHNAQAVISHFAEAKYITAA